MGKILRRKTVLIQHRIQLGKFAWSSMDFWWYNKENILKHKGKKKKTSFLLDFLPQRRVKHEHCLHFNILGTIYCYVMGYRRAE